VSCGENRGIGGADARLTMPPAGRSLTTAVFFNRVRQVMVVGDVEAVTTDLRCAKRRLLPGHALGRAARSIHARAARRPRHRAALAENARFLWIALRTGHGQDTDDGANPQHTEITAVSLLKSAQILTLQGLLQRGAAGLLGVRQPQFLQHVRRWMECQRSRRHLPERWQHQVQADLGG
jgi:hypothetical protein